MRRWLDYLDQTQEEQVLASLGLTVDEALAMAE